MNSPAPSPGDPTFSSSTSRLQGLNEVETAELADLLRSALKELSCGIVLIDHDVSFIMGACHRVEVLDAGTAIFVGEPEIARSDSRVIEAYLGMSA